MAKYLNIAILCFSLLGGTSCSNHSGSNNGQNAESALSGSNDILTGSMTVVVDETVADLMEQQLDVFRSSYTNTDVQLVTDLERPAINRLLRGEGQVAILKRKLTDDEAKSFTQRSIKPRIFPVGFDAVVFAVSAESADTTISFATIGSLLGGTATADKQLVIDNINSSTVRTLREVTKVPKVSGAQVNEAGSAEEVLDAVSAQSNRVGILTYNQYLAMRDSLGTKDKIRILSVTKGDGQKAYRPTQTTLGDDTYPLKQEVFVLNYQPNMGLGIGFSAFLTGDRGQRVILKYGLLPATMPGRELIIRDEANF